MRRDRTREPAQSQPKEAPRAALRAPPDGTGKGGGPHWETACTPEQIAARGSRKPVNLALQGGGAHGAFAWGVLDKLLEDGRLAPDAVSATSAGAMNAVAMAVGMSEGSYAGARACRWCSTRSRMMMPIFVPSEVPEF